MYGMDIQQNGAAAWAIAGFKDPNDCGRTECFGAHAQFHFHDAYTRLQAL
jgi:hypothetical protein